MRNKVLLGMAVPVATLALVAGCSSGNAQTASTTSGTQTAAKPPTKDDIAKEFDVWNAALATGSPEQVADLYAPDAVLLPTVSNEVRTNRAAIVDYFQHFLENKPSGVIEQEVVSVLDADTAINTGVYRFTLTQDGVQQQVVARYTFVYELISGKWLIVNHHSSAMPEK